MIILFSGHLCSTRCQQVLDGDYTFIKSLQSQGFQRIQINATKANDVSIDLNNLSSYVDNLLHGMISIPELEWIIQCNAETMFLYEALINQPTTNMSLLYDSSCGLGTLISEIQAPRSNIPCGYAGGIGPSNILDICQNIEGVVDNQTSIWIDMESSLRSIVIDKKAGEERDIFSIDKCFECITRLCDKYSLEYIP